MSTWFMWSWPWGALILLSGITCRGARTILEMPVGKVPNTPRLLCLRAAGRSRLLRLRAARRSRLLRLRTARRSPEAGLPPHRTGAMQTVAQKIKKTEEPFLVHRSYPTCLKQLPRINNKKSECWGVWAVQMLRNRESTPMSENGNLTHR